MAVTREQLARIQCLQQTLEGQRSMYESDWKDITKYVLSQTNGWDKRTDPQGLRPLDTRDRYDSTAVRATETFASGLQGYAFGPSVDWLSLSTEEADSEHEATEEELRWLQWLARIVARKLAKSNFYSESLSFTKIGVNFGTAVMTFGWDEVAQLPVFHVVHPVECVGLEDAYGKVDTLVTDMWLNKSDALAMFGPSNVPDYVLQADNYGKNFLFHHLRCPRGKLDLSIDGDLPYVHVIYADDYQTVSREWQSERADFAVWRYDRRTRRSFWGEGAPGQTTLPDIRMLNSMVKDKIRLSQLAGAPPLVGSKGLRPNFRPNGYIGLEPTQSVSLLQVTGSLDWTQQSIEDCRTAIREAYYTNFFLALSQSLGRDKTATEVQGLQEEQSRIMSAFLSRLQSEFFEPVVDSLMEELTVHGLVDDMEHPIPQSLMGKELHVDFTSPLYRIQQRAMALTPTRTLLSDALQMAQVSPEALDIIDTDAYLKTEAEIEGADKRVIRDTRVVAQIRQQRAQVQLQQQELQNQLQRQDMANRQYSAFSRAPEEGSPMAQGGVTNG